MVDNGPEENDSASLQSYVQDKVIYEVLPPNRGYTGGINHGLEVAAKINPAYILILNNDTLIDPNALQELVSAAGSFENQCIVTGKVYDYQEQNRLQYIGHKLRNKQLLKFTRLGTGEYDSGQYDEIIEMDLLDDIYWLLPIEVVNKIGKYNEYFWFNGESADYALRAKKSEIKLVYTYKAKLWHKGSMSLGGRSHNPKITYWQTQSTLIFRYLHLKPFYFLLFYFSLIGSSLYGYLKTFRLTGEIRKNRRLQLFAKYKAVKYFNRWIFFNQPNKGINPF